jgi:hypothetical protein
MAISLHASYTDWATAADGEVSADFADRECCVVTAADPYVL